MKLTRSNASSKQIVTRPATPPILSVHRATGPTVKAAKKDACRQMHDFFKEQEEEDPDWFRCAADTKHRVVEAMLGDAVLKMILLMHFPSDSDSVLTRDDSSIASSIDTDPGTLNNFIVEHSTNNFLYHRYLSLAKENKLPDDLPEPNGHAQADPTNFEAWIGRVFTRCGGNLHATARYVLPALGVDEQPVERMLSAGGTTYNAAAAAADAA